MLAHTGEACTPAIGNLLKLFHAHSLPGPVFTGVEMNEIGGRIIADTASPHRKRRISNVFCRKTFDAYIYCAAFHMQTVLGDAGALVA